MSMPSVDADDGNDGDMEMDFDEADIFDVLGCRTHHHAHGDHAVMPCRRKSLHLHRRDMALTQPLMMKQAQQTRAQCTRTRVRNNWLKLARKARNIKDPWQAFHIEKIETEVCLRYRYNAVRKTWTTDEILVKMENTSFNRGAMRECYRLKKLSSFVKSEDWQHASNYVAKRYMENVDEEVYRSDVQLQMQAKLWGEHYNRSDPPKQVDIMQMCLIEFKNREGRPLFHLEHFIEGNYIKYNSNSGFVEEQLRNTPQSFSHFTFERSGHKLIVVDIQGVGDLYTDPQIHTAEGTEYGDGNLGARGMALFFHSHMCNAICESLRLTPFDLAPSEEAQQEKIILSASNSVASTMIKADLNSPLPPLSSPLNIEDMRSRCDSGLAEEESTEGESSEVSDVVSLSPTSPFDRFPRRKRLDTSSSDMDLTLNVMTREDVELWHQQQCSFHRPSRADTHLCSHGTGVDAFRSVLGQIHHEMARFHEAGRFLIDREHDAIDWEAALFHEKMAADHGFLEAVLTMARYYLRLPHDVLVECPIQASEEDTTKGLMYMTRAAEAGDRASMVFLGESYQRAQFGCEKDWEVAARWYAMAVAAADDTDADGGYDATMETPVYELQARLGDMYLDGGHYLEADPSSAGDYYTEAAEGATNAMKGRRAARLFELAEEAYGRVEEE